MKQRCTNEKLEGYKNYGGRGITYDPRWNHFVEFNRDMGPRPSPQHTLERLNNDGNYEKSNCSWVNRHEQAMNRRTFKNNTSGYRGVAMRPNGRFFALIDFKNVRYRAGGSFATGAEAAQVREAMLLALMAGDDVSQFLKRPARYDSGVGLRGVSAHSNGGYTVRRTVGGERKYLGYFKKLEEALRALNDA
jgi:hypothetical protein